MADDLPIEGMSASYLLRVERFESVDSTMDVARRRAREGAEEGTTIVATAQLEGRGRRGRQWFSAPGAGVWATTILRPSTRPPHTLGPVCAVAVAEGLCELGADDARIKWPNDVILAGREQGGHHGGRKLAGILLEGDHLDTATPVVLVGMGINIAPTHTLDLPEELEGRYVGLLDILGSAPASSRGWTSVHDEVLGAVLARLKHWYELWLRQGPTAIVDTWPRWDALAGQPVRAEARGGAIMGIARGIDTQGRLRVETPSGPITVTSGEVERILKGDEAAAVP